MASRLVPESGRNEVPQGSWDVVQFLLVSLKLPLFGVEVRHGYCRRQSIILGVWSPKVAGGLDVTHGGPSGVRACNKTVLVIKLVQ